MNVNCVKRVPGFRQSSFSRCRDSREDITRSVFVREQEAKLNKCNAAE